MRAFSFRLWNIQSTGQYEKWQITKEFIISLLCSKFIDDASLDRAFIFWLAFLHKDSICSLKFRWLSVLIPKSFSHLLLEIVSFPTVILLESLSEKRRWYLPGLAFMLLPLNQFKSMFPKTSTLCITYAEFPPLFRRVLCRQHNWLRLYFWYKEINR